MTSLPLQADPFLERLLAYLIPFFRAIAEPARARSAILQALASFSTRTESEMLEAAQILALGFCTMESLGESTADALSPAQRMRWRGNANALNRSKKQCQGALAASLRAKILEGASTVDADRKAPATGRPKSPDIQEPVTTELEWHAIVPVSTAPEPVPDLEPPAEAIRVSNEATRPAETARLTENACQSPGDDRDYHHTDPFAAPGDKNAKYKSLWASVMTDLAKSMRADDAPPPSPTPPQ